MAANIATTIVFFLMLSFIFTAPFDFCVARDNEDLPRYGIPLRYEESAARRLEAFWRTLLVRGVWRVTRRGIRVFVASALRKPEHDSTPHWSKARVAPFCEGSRIFIQDVGSKEDMELIRKDSSLSSREFPVESLGHCQSVGNGLHSL